MKNLILLASVIISCTFISCEDDTPQPTPPQPQQCEVNNWSYMRFENRSNTGKTYDVYLDGSRIVQGLEPGEISSEFTVSATYHEYVFKKANSSSLACSAAYPTMAQCVRATFYCTY